MSYPVFDEWERQGLRPQDATFKVPMFHEVEVEQARRVFMELLTTAMAPMAMDDASRALDTIPDDVLVYSARSKWRAVEMASWVKAGMPVKTV